LNNYPDFVTYKLLTTLQFIVPVIFTRHIDQANVLRLIYPSTDIQLPIRPDGKKSPRLQFLDTGLLNYNLQNQGELMSLTDLNEACRGAVVPHLVMQEIISLNTYSDQKPNFWVREKKQSSAEVDLILPYKDKIIPVEIKSGKVGKLRSLHQFVRLSQHPYVVRLFAGEFSIEQHNAPDGRPFLLMNLPYYLTTQLMDYIEYFLINGHRVS